jgi:SAM-dependent methyltransferase
MATRKDDRLGGAANALSVSEVYERNRRAWDAASDAYQRAHGEQLAREPQAWGVWSVPESELLLLGDVHGRDVLEYGCGAAQWSIALARRGARVTGLDNSSRQLDHARAAITAAGVDVRLVHAPGEATTLAAQSFDLVFCDHGAMSFAAPEQTIPEVARLLRPGGVLVFNMEHPLHAVCWDDAAGGPIRALGRSYFELDRSDDPVDGTVNFSRPLSVYGELLARHGFVIERFVEPRPSADALTSYVDYVAREWARDFPAELIIRARRG